MTCEQCLCVIPCRPSTLNEMYENKAERCPYFKNKAEFIEAVRCEKCIHKIDYKGSVMCKRNAYIIALEFGDEWRGLIPTHPDHFCSYGERK